MNDRFQHFAAHPYYLLGVTAERDRILQLFRAALDAEAAACPGGVLVKGSVQEKNARVIAMLVAGTRSLMVPHARAAIHLLRTSERIYQDCLLALDQADNGRFALNVCVREWSDLHPSSEWRCFCRCTTRLFAAFSDMC